MNRNEILKIIHDMKPKPGGIDRINAKTLQILAEFFADPLLHIINKSIELAIWPEKLKLAEIYPIPEEGAKHLLCNHRPISSISTLAKIFEKIIYNRISNFARKHQILSKKQFGFIKGMGPSRGIKEFSVAFFS